VDGLPWHPAIVHLPIGLGLVVPLVALLAAIGLWRGGGSRRGWGLVVLLQAIVFGTGLLAMRTGEQEEEHVAKVVAEELIEEHEERAEVFMWLAGAALAAGAAGLVLPAGAALRVALGAAVLLSVAAGGAVASAGHLGGRLVYVHGAAQAHGDQAAGNEAPARHDHD
jgi:uncharacterized membrane protein